MIKVTLGAIGQGTPSKMKSWIAATFGATFRVSVRLGWRLGLGLFEHWQWLTFDCGSSGFYSDG